MKKQTQSHPLTDACLQSEQSVLGMLMLGDSGANQKAFAVLHPEDFGYEAHRLIFEAVRDMDKAGTVADLITLGTELERREQIERVGGRSYLAQLLDEVVTTGHMEYTARQVLEYAQRRALSGSVYDIAAAIKRGETSEAVLSSISKRVEEMRARTAGSQAPETFTGSELLQMELPTPKCIIDGILYEGLSVLAGPPKMGKSWLVLQWAIAVASGGMVLSKFPAQQGEVLYIAAEDGKRRLQDRIRKVLASDPGITEETLSRLHFKTEWPRLDMGGIPAAEGWLAQHPQCLLVIMDTLQRLRPPANKAGTAYQDDYSAMIPVHELSKRYHVCILFVHHTRKSQAGLKGDALEELSGSLGIPGAADGTLVLRRPRGESDGTLCITGRDTPEQEMAVRFSDGLWSYIGDSQAVQGSSERQDILDTLMESGRPLSPIEIARNTGMQCPNVRQLLISMRDTGAVRRAGYGKYEVSPDAAPGEQVPASAPRGWGGNAQNTQNPDHTDHTDHTYHSYSSQNSDHTDHGDHSYGGMEGGAGWSDP
jgi:hypothetical protein